MMPVMRDLSYHYKIPGRSIPTVHGRFQQLLLALQNARRYIYRSRVISGEALTNAVMLHFLDLGRDEQERILDVYVPRFEALVDAEPEPAPAGKAPTTSTIDATSGQGKKGRRQGAG